MKRIYLSAPDVTALESRFVNDAIASGWIAPVGPELDAFENAMCERVGVAHAVALSSGTAALHLGLVGLGVQPGDVVMTSTMTFAATANAIRYVGAQPYFVDSSREDGNIDVDLLEAAIAQSRSAGRQVGAILPVDLLGKCADLTRISKLARAAEVPLIIDAAESVGATHRGRPSGSFGDAATFSFNGNKVMTTSGGGMLLTDDPQLAARVRHLSSQARLPVLHYEHDEVGYNYRLSNLLAALGRGQLSRLDEMIARRREIRARYREFFEGQEGVAIFGGNDSEDNCWLTAILAMNTEWHVTDLMSYLESRAVESRPLWKPLHLQRAFSTDPSMINGNAQWLFEHGLALPSGSGLNDCDVDRVIHEIDTFLKRVD